MTIRAVPMEARYALEGKPPGSRQYAAYLYRQGYTLASIGGAMGVTRQAVHQHIATAGTVTQPPAGFPAVPRVRRQPRKRAMPPMDRRRKAHLLGMWMLSTRHRGQHSPDSPWSVAAATFLEEVAVLQEEGYSAKDIAEDIGVPPDALYRRLQRARR